MPRTGGDPDFAASFSSAPINLLSYGLPNLFGNRVEAPFVGDWSYWESLGYIGLIPLLLVLVAPVALPKHRAWPGIIVITASLVVALGAHTPLFDIYLSLIPGADLFRSPGRFCLLVTLLGSLLAAEVLDRWIAGSLSPRRKTVTLAMVWGIALLVPLSAWQVFSLDMTGFVSWIEAHINSQSHQTLQTADWSKLTDLAGQDVAKATLVLLGTAVVLTFSARFAARAKIAGALMVAVAVFDLFHFGQRFFTTGPASHFHMPPRVVDTLIADKDPGLRIIPPAEKKWYNFPAAHAVGNPGGYDIFLDRRYARYINRSKMKPLDRFVALERIRHGSPLIRHLGPKYLLTLHPLRNGRNRFISGYDWVEKYKEIDGIYIYKSRTEPKRVALAHRLEVISDEEQTYRRMERYDFDLQEVVLIEASPPKEFTRPKPRNPNAEEHARISLLEPNRVEISVEAASDAVLVMSDTLLPGWEARVDGEEVPMIHANRVMRAVPVTKGEHTVVMTYLPGAFVIGLVISISAILGLFALILVKRMRARCRVNRRVTISTVQ